ncbi:PREDICTED: neurotrypsin-like isoform X2 [Amphimedon queenslandica]|uniref:SRCR domain-containing protein n=1 Tax=Amphimedon queenslandica TaxID=400682 RepID=A0AAN0J6E8_AMPQE|nr:PREDICTED: neurotrypsin-like isoform X2 [Amphimedon queenslandica]|eukprot:XP_019852604.1 PREDICTED: neurotrypsin-like isoform X2 [Amphimedon queenslandica]
MFLNVLIVTSIFIYTVCSASDEGDRLWDVTLDPLQLNYDAEGWMTICHDGINLDVAHVVCRQKGFTNATSLEISNLLSVSDFVITKVVCPSTSNYFLYGETNIMRCNIADPVKKEQEACSLAKISCNTDTIKKTDPYKGQLYLDRTETESPADGVVEVFLDNDWYHVCKTSFTDTVANSICRQYGYTGSDSWTTVEPASSVKGVLVTEYSCKTSSFECFSHCIPSTYSIDSCEDHVTLTCSFDVTEKYITSGSRSQCALDECSQCEKSLQNYRIITGSLSSLLLFSVVVFLIIVIWFCCKKKCCCCCRKDYANLPDHRVRYRVDGDRNDE